MSPSTLSSGKSQTMKIPAAGATLTGDLVVPPGAHGVVLFAHGSGSSRMSPRNQRVAKALQQGGFATLLFDLLTPEEDTHDTRTGEFRFDVALLAKRLAGATDWTMTQRETRGLHVSYFGASTGAAAALIAAAVHPGVVRAVVSRGGRPDLAGPYLGRVIAPTLLIVGGDDTPVIGMNRAALEQLRSTTSEIAIVPGASHLFEEPGALDEVARLALDWFSLHGGRDTPPVDEGAFEIC